MNPGIDRAFGVKVAVGVAFSLLSVGAAHAGGPWITKVSRLHADSSGLVSFNSQAPIPTNLGAGCAFPDWNALQGDRNSTAFKTMISILQTAMLTGKSVEIYTSGCSGNDNAVTIVRQLTY